MEQALGMGSEFDLYILKCDILKANFEVGDRNHIFSVHPFAHVLWLCFPFLLRSKFGRLRKKHCLLTVCYM